MIVVVVAMSVVSVLLTIPVKAHVQYEGILEEYEKLRTIKMHA